MAPRTLTSAGWPRPGEPPPPQHDPSRISSPAIAQSGRKLRLLPRCRFFPPLRACRHNVFNSQYRIFTAFFRQQLPQLSHRLICRLRHRAVVFWCPFSVSIRRLTLPVAVLQKRWPHCPFPSAFAAHYRVIRHAYPLVLASIQPVGGSHCDASGGPLSG